MIRKWLRDRKRMQIAQRILEGEDICRECSKPKPQKFIPYGHMSKELGDCESCRKVVYKIRQEHITQMRNWISKNIRTQK
jgi:hypothetical protein